MKENLLPEDSYLQKIKRSEKAWMHVRLSRSGVKADLSVQFTLYW